jgi:hypothetical protein
MRRPGIESIPPDSAAEGSAAGTSDDEPAERRSSNAKDKAGGTWAVEKLITWGNAIRFWLRALLGGR